jgi:hypothetical protein
MDKKRTGQRAQERNGIKAPIKGVCAVAWDVFSASKQPLACADLPALAEQTGLNLGNLQIELRRWKRFNGHAARGGMTRKSS